ncbi:hypothetical protein MNBD_GAMMA22-439 [hydrothermal vent metagenome]|uniref:Uncharacterized protein n=1 Tax=hydrothermal vent metagenome TaxID=652676 RepID=A0A3B1AS26_9ZZZZ
METFVEIFQGIPFIILASVIFGAVAFIRLYIMRIPSIQRLSVQDRRQSSTTISFPFHDKSNKLINEDRRKSGDRRVASYVSMDLNYNKVP